MKKLKDFIYDKNDIVIAILILAVAALIISWRLGIILEYPKQLLGTDDPVIQTPVNNDDAQSEEENENQGTEGPGQSEENDPENEGPQSGENAGQNNTDIPLWDGGTLTEDVEVEVAGASASAAIKCLVDAGLFEDYAEYQSICDAEGMNHEKVAAGTFTFTKGTTKTQIAKKINWS